MPKRHTSMTRWPVLGILLFGLLLGCQGSGGGEGRTGGDPGGGAGAVGGEASGELPDTATWRTEVYSDVAVEVPADWGWGAGPYSPRVMNQVWCPDRVVLPDGNFVSYTKAPHVARPDGLTDACLLPTHLPSGGPAMLWFDAGYPDGVRTIGERTAETRTVAGIAVTVVDDDAARRTAILASARLVQGTDVAGCRPTAENPGGISPEGIGPVVSLSACLYRRGPNDGYYRIASARLPAAVGERLVDAVYTGSRNPPLSSCRTLEPEQVVTLVVTNRDVNGAPGALLRTRFFVDPRCGNLIDAHGQVKPLTEEMLGWVSGPMRAHLVSDVAPLAGLLLPRATG